MIYSAIRERNKYFKSGMMVAGLATIGHSGLAYLADKRGVQGAALPYAEPVAWKDVTPEPATYKTTQGTTASAPASTAVNQEPEPTMDDVIMGLSEMDIDDFFPSVEWANDDNEQ